MKVDIIFALTGKRQTAWVEIHNGHIESAIWDHDESDLDENELSLVEEILADQLRQSAHDYAIDEQYDRRRDRQWE